MAGRIRRHGNQTSPKRTKVWVEPPPKRHHHQQLQLQQRPRRIPVVYYLCRSRHLEHPHFIEVPVSSPEGLYLRDVIDRLRVLRGKRMAAMYSWSCKRSYKSGFVWHDLSEDDLVLPAQGNEYVLKGSELKDRSPPDRHGRGFGDGKSQKHPKKGSSTSYGTHEASSSSSSPPIVVKEAKLLQEGELSFGNLSPDAGGITMASSPSLAEYRVCKPTGAQDASTQTDGHGGRKTRTAGISIDDGSFGAEFKEGLEIAQEAISPTPTSSPSSLGGGKMDTLENLIRAEAASRMNNLRIIEQEDVLGPMRAKLKATNLLIHLISCGSISVKDHHHSFGLVPTYRPRFTHVDFTSPMVLGELGWRPDKSRATALRLEEECFCGSLMEAKNRKEEVGASSSDEDRICKMSSLERDKENVMDSKHSKCLLQTIKITSRKQSRYETMTSPILDARNSSAGPDCKKTTPLNSLKGGSGRIIDASTVKGSYMGLESFKDEKEKLIMIEERLNSGARVIIQSRSPCDNNKDGAGSQ